MKAVYYQGKHSLSVGPCLKERPRPGEKVVVRPLVSCSTCPAGQVGYGQVCHHLRFLGIDIPGAFQELWNVPEFAEAESV